MTFIATKDIEWENLDWGDLGWVVRPANVPEASGLAVLDVILQPGNGHDFHKHPNQEEAIYVVDGEVEQWVKEEHRILSANEAVFVPKDTVHATFVAENAASPAHLLVVLSPSYSEAGYEAVDVATEEPWNSLR